MKRFNLPHLGIGVGLRTERAQALWRIVLRPAMASLLRSLAPGVPLGKALSAVSAGASESLAAADVMAWFSAWVQAGFFRAIELAGADT
jgi:hypothetical protein